MPVPTFRAGPFDQYQPDPPCTECNDTGIADYVDPHSPRLYRDFCHCDTGEQMRRDYEAEQVDREEDERDAPTIGDLYRKGKI